MSDSFDYLQKKSVTFCFINRFIGVRTKEVRVLDVSDELLKKYYNPALLYVFSLCKNYALAEDIVSNAFFKALSLCDDKTDYFKPWLFRVCKNEYYDYKKKHKRVAELKKEIDDKRDLAEDAIVKEEYKSLYRAIQILPEAYREVITLFYFFDMSIEEMSKICGKNSGQIKVVLFRARQKLKNILEVKYGF